MMRVIAIVPAIFFGLPLGFAANASAQECDCTVFNTAVQMCEESGTDDHCIDTVMYERSTKKQLTHACVQKCADDLATKKLTEEEVSGLETSPFVPQPAPPGAMLDEPADEVDDDNFDDLDANPNTDDQDIDVPDDDDDDL